MSRARVLASVAVVAALLVAGLSLLGPDQPASSAHDRLAPSHPTVLNSKPRSGTPSILISGFDPVPLPHDPMSQASPVLYTVTVNETGLPAGSEWDLSVVNATPSSENGTTALGNSPSIALSLPNGTYEIHAQGPCCEPPYFAIPGTFPVVVRGLPLNFSVRMVIGYSVSFGMGDLGEGNVTLWFAGYAVNLAAAGWSFFEPNGTYPFQVSQAPGYIIEPRFGNVTVAGANVSVVININYFEYPVQFVETGLPNGTWWEVTTPKFSQPTDYGYPYLQATNIPVLNLELSNGTFGFSVFTGGPVGFEAVPATGNLTVDASGSTHWIVFSSTASPPSTEWSLTLDRVLVTAIGCLALGAAVMFVVTRLRPRRPE